MAIKTGNIKRQERNHINQKFKSIVWTVKHDTGENYKGLWRFRQFGGKNLVWIFYFDKTNYKFYILNFQNFTYLKNKRQGNPGLQDFTHEQNSTRFSSYIS